MWGFVLANVAPGKEPEFFSNVSAIQQVRHVFYLFDEYEYLLEVEADSTPELARLLTNHLRHLPGVERTASFIEGNAKEFQPVERDDLAPVKAETSLY